MEMKRIFVCVLFFMVPFLWAEPVATIEERKWTAKSGHVVEASVLKVEEGVVHLQRSNGKVVEVPLATFVASDEAMIRKHFSIPEGPIRAKGSGVAQASNLALPMGKVSGPVQAGKSNYFVYVPKSLKEGREAPLLFYTNAGGGKATTIKELQQHADLFGWIVAISVESKNDGGWESNARHVKACLDHLLETLPIDEDRLHYTGNSGGGAMAFVGSSIKEAYGVMPNIAYIPGHIKEKTEVVYGLGGGADFNRYLTGYAASKYGEKGFHRMTAKGHSGAPAQHRSDGMFWMHCHFLADERSGHQDEAKDFELVALDWLQGMKKRDPARAYSNGVFLKEIYGPSGANGKILDLLLDELKEDANHVLYHEALLAISDFSKEHFSPFGSGGTKSGHLDSSLAARIEQELGAKYSGLPEVAKVIEAMKGRSASPKKK